MHTKHLVKAPLLALVGLLAILIVPAAAQANHVTDIDVTCDRVGEWTGDPGRRSSSSSRPKEKYTSRGTITIDGKVVPRGRIRVTDDTRSTVSVAGAREPGTLVFVTPASSRPARTPSRSTSTGRPGRHRQRPARRSLPPAPPVTPADDPAGQPAAVTAPGGGLLPESIVSGLARLRGPSGCVKQAFRARVRGRSIASVTFFVDGKLVKRINGKRTRYAVKIQPEQLRLRPPPRRRARQFIAASGTAARRLPLTFRRCAQGAVAPRFTG